MLAQACVPASQSHLSAAPHTNGPLVTSPRAATAQSPVILYGDSIGYEITPYLKSRLAVTTKQVLVSRVFGGTNACDWLGAARADNIKYKPKYVVIVFVGNFFTQCMNFIGQLPTTAALVDRTIGGIKNLMAIFPKAHIFLVGFPRSVASQVKHDAGEITVADLLNWKLLKLAQSSGSTYVPTTQVMYDSRGRAQTALPCIRNLDGYFCGSSGKVIVRAPDGLHLCPVTPPAVLGVLPKCAVPSPGANRITKLIHAALLRDIALNR